MRGRATLTAVLVATAGVAPASAAAQIVDPDFDSPSGVVYEIPLDSGRGDAAPAPQQDPPGAAPEATAAPQSSIRSENGFGSSSSVPGAKPKESTKGEGAAGAQSGGGGAPDDAAVREQTIVAGSVGAAPSTDRAIILVVLAAVAAAALGVAGRQGLRRR